MDYDKLSERFIIVERVVYSQNERLDQFEKALENYREYKTAIEDLKTDVMYLKQQIDELTQKLNDFINYPNITWAKYNKTPHKCPVCGGSGKVNHIEKYKGKDGSCLACEGKGIVWG